MNGHVYHRFKTLTKCKLPQLTTWRLITNSGLNVFRGHYAADLDGNEISLRKFRRSKTMENGKRAISGAGPERNYFIAYLLLTVSYYFFNKIYDTDYQKYHKCISLLISVLYMRYSTKL